MTVLISRINSWESCIFLTSRKNKQVSHAPSTWNGSSAYLVIQSYKQYYKFVVSLSYILEQLVFTAPRVWVHLCLAHRIDWPSLPHGGAMLPPAHSLAWHGSSWAWLALISVINLPTLAVPINHTYKFCYNYHMKSTSLYIYLTLWAHDIFIYTYKLLFLFLFFLPVTKQVSWLRPLVLGTVLHRTYCTVVLKTVQSHQYLQYSTVLNLK